MMQSKISRRFRIIGLVVALFAAILFILSGSMSQMEMSEAQGIYAEFEIYASQIMSIQGIFLNNFLICLIIFVPVVGPLYAFFVMYSTGRIIAAISMIKAVNPVALFVTTFIFPHSWIEFGAYALAISQNVWLIVGILQHRYKEELLITFKTIVANAIILFAAALVEMATITILSG